MDDCERFPRGQETIFHESSLYLPTGYAHPFPARRQSSRITQQLSAESPDSGKSAGDKREKKLPGKRRSREGWRETRETELEARVKRAWPINRLTLVKCNFIVILPLPFSLSRVPHRHIYVHLYSYISGKRAGQDELVDKQN